MKIHKIILQSLGWALVVGSISFGIQNCKADGIPGLNEPDQPGTPEVWVPFETKEKQLFHLKKLLPYGIGVYPFYWKGSLGGDTVVPEGNNYYYYFDKYPCLYGQVLKIKPKECDGELVEESKEPVDVIEPAPIGMLGMALIALAIKRTIKRYYRV